MLNKSTEDMLETLRNPRWALAGPTTDQSPIALDCMQNGIAGVFVASPLDPEEWGRQVYADCLAEKYGPIGPYVAAKETVNDRMTRQTAEVQTYMQDQMVVREPGPDRQMIYSELQAATTTQGYHFYQIPEPWDRPVEPSDEQYFDAGLQAYKDTIDYLNTQVKGAKLPPFTRGKARFPSKLRRMM